MVPEAEMTCIVQILILMWCFLIEEIFERIVFFNELNSYGMAIAGIKVDINPILEERITLAEYIKESEAYLDQQEIRKLAVDLDNLVMNMILMNIKIPLKIGKNRSRKSQRIF